MGWFRSNIYAKLTLNYCIGLAKTKINDETTILQLNQCMFKLTCQIKLAKI